MAHLHRQAGAGAPVRQVTGDDRSRYSETVIITNSPGLPVSTSIT
jgi:negative regulator of sigma E activity